MEVARQGVWFSHASGDAGDISELLSESKAEAGPEVETRAPRHARVYVVESSESEPEERSQAQLALPSPRATLTKKMTRSQIFLASKPSSAYPMEAGKKKHKSSNK